MRQRALAQGVVDVIARPLDTRLLQTRLRRALAGAAAYARCGPAATLLIMCAGGLTLTVTAREVSEGALDRAPHAPRSPLAAGSHGGGGAGARPPGTAGSRLK